MFSCPTSKRPASAVPRLSDISPEAQAWNLAMFGNNIFFAFCISSRGIKLYEILPGWELASGLAFSESKMAALTRCFLITQVLRAI